MGLELSSVQEVIVEMEGKKERGEFYNFLIVLVK